MCGIIGMIGKRDSVGALIAGLDRLAYRGYDSAGLAVITDHGIDRRRAEGKIDNLRARLHAEPLLGPTGIGHTRWATHGIANEQNAHPHATSHVALVHNGIIENYRQIRAELQTPGDLTSDTDSEVIAHFLQDLLESGSHPIQAVQHLQSKLEGAFAFVFMFSKYPELLIGIRRGSALAVGYGDGEMYIGSDALALAHLTRQIAYLEEGDLVVLSRERAEFYDAGKMPAQRPIVQSTQSGALTGKGNYRHYMLKEIHEQPVVIGDLLSGLINLQSRALAMAEPPFDAQKAKTMTITACGTACYAGLIGSYWLEQCARLRCCVDTGSEFRYRNPPLDPGQPGLFISQSGETMDTLEAMRLAKAGGLKTTAIVNVVESSIAREADQVQAMLAGPEIGVASTKAFTAMLVSLAALSLDLARIRG
ncbi:MAG: glutamine--fructose-6-phosphate transaminase (isomerizing), partial [Pseudomonadota bacterium]